MNRATFLIALKSFYERKLHLLSVIATPFIIFVITSVELFLINRVDLDNRIIVLWPFLAVFLVVVLIGYLLYYHQAKHKFLKHLLITYYLLGPLFILFTFIRQISTTPIIKSLILLTIFAAVFSYIYKKVDIQRLARAMCVIALALISWQVLVVASNFGTFIPSRNNILRSGSETHQEITATEGLPNIYHIVLDEYQTDMFELTLNDEAKEELGGFIYYPENTTVYGKTGMSLASLFSGTVFNPDENTKLEYEDNAINSDKSLIYDLKQAGYSTRAYVHDYYPSESQLFDEVIKHNDNITGLDSSYYVKLFMKIWAYSNMPEKIAEKVTGTEFLRQAKQDNLLTDDYPVVASESFSNITKDKDMLKESNTYNFIHLIMPHVPYVLRTDCSYDGELMENDFELAALEQSRCASKHLFSFLRTLKELNLYEDSLIVVQADHGSRFITENGNLIRTRFKENGKENVEWSLARARALLLIKAPSKKEKEQFFVSDAETTLLDITPTVAEVAGISLANADYEGVPLTGPDAAIPSRESRYYYFPKKEENGYSVGLHRYIIKNSTLNYDRYIPLSKR